MWLYLLWVWCKKDMARDPYWVWSIFKWKIALAAIWKEPTYLHNKWDWFVPILAVLRKGNIFLRENRKKITSNGAVLLIPLFKEDTPEYKTPGHVSDAIQPPKGDLASDRDTPFSPRSRRQGVAGSTTGSRGQWDRAGEEAPTCPRPREPTWPSLCPLLWPMIWWIRHWAGRGEQARRRLAIKPRQPEIGHAQHWPHKDQLTQRTSLFPPSDLPWEPGGQRITGFWWYSELCFGPFPWDGGNERALDGSPVPGTEQPRTRCPVNTQPSTVQLNTTNQVCPCKQLHRWVN